MTLEPVSKVGDYLRFSGYHRADFHRCRYLAVLPALNWIREHAAERSAREDAAWALQRAFADLIAGIRCRRVCKGLMEVSRGRVGPSDHPRVATKNATSKARGKARVSHASRLATTA